MHRVRPPKERRYGKKPMTQSAEGTGFKSLPVVAGIALVFFLLVFLGFWQINRAHEKTALIHLQQVRGKEPAVEIAGPSGQLADLQHRNVSVSGRFDAKHQFLLDNRVVDGKVGVYVLTPLRIKGSHWAILVNRGWVPMTKRREVNTDLGIATPEVRIHGRVNNFPGVGFKFKDSEIPTKGWPAWVQVVDEARLSELLGYPLLPYQILLDNDAGQGYVRNWDKPYPMSPERHIAYAVQWFALAAVLALIFFWGRFRVNG